MICKKYFWREFMKYLMAFSLFALVSCGGGSGAYNPPNSDIPSTSSTTSNILPGSVNSFQPLDIDE